MPKLGLIGLDRSTDENDMIMHKAAHLIHNAIYFYIAEINGRVVLQQSCKEALDLARLNPASVV